MNSITREPYTSWSHYYKQLPLLPWECVQGCTCQQQSILKLVKHYQINTMYEYPPLLSLDMPKSYVSLHTPFFHVLLSLICWF